MQYSRQHLYNETVCRTAHVCAWNIQFVILSTRVRAVCSYIMIHQSLKAKSLYITCTFVSKILSHLVPDVYIHPARFVIRCNRVKRDRCLVQFSWLMRKLRGISHRRKLAATTFDHTNKLISLRYYIFPSSSCSSTVPSTKGDDEIYRQHKIIGVRI